MTENITVPDLEVTISFPIVKDDGSPEVIKAFRVHHSHYKEPCKGGDCIFVYIYVSVVLNLQAWMVRYTIHRRLSSSNPQKMFELLTIF